MKNYKDFGVYDFSDYAEEITGKDCPKYFVNYENEWIKFKEDVFLGL